MPEYFLIISGFYNEKKCLNPIKYNRRNPKIFKNILALLFICFFFDLFIVIIGIIQVFFFFFFIVLYG